MLVFVHFVFRAGQMRRQQRRRSTSKSSTASSSSGWQCQLSTSVTQCQQSRCVADIA